MILTVTAYAVVGLLALAVLIWIVRGLIWLLGWAIAIGLVAYSTIRCYLKQLHN